MAETTPVTDSHELLHNERDTTAKPDRPGEVDKETVDGATTTTSTGGEDDESVNYPGPAALTLLMVGISAACFIVALDRTIVATAIPKITDDFNSPGDVGWYGSAYLLVSLHLRGRANAYYSPVLTELETTDTTCARLHAHSNSLSVVSLPTSTSAGLSYLPCPSLSSVA